jgi:hypothetical protein
LLAPGYGSPQDDPVQVSDHLCVACNRQLDRATLQALQLHQLGINPVLQEGWKCLGHADQATCWTAMDLRPPVQVHGDSEQ